MENCTYGGKRKVAFLDLKLALVLASVVMLVGYGINSSSSNPVHIQRL
jgi:hypothetical protein